MVNAFIWPKVVVWFRRSLAKVVECAAPTFAAVNVARLYLPGDVGLADCRIERGV